MDILVSKQRYFGRGRMLINLKMADCLLEVTFLTSACFCLQDFYDIIEDLDPNNGDHLFVCLGGDYTVSKNDNMPYRGVDSTFSERYCSSGEAIVDPDTGLTIGVNLTTAEEVCNHYEFDEIEHIPTIQQNVQAALDVLSKDEDGFFLMYEQGDIDWAAHGKNCFWRCSKCHNPVFVRSPLACACLPVFTLLW